jgi:type II secretory pathway pseudopilin PulG
MFHRSQTPRRPRRGYTLVEAMVALSLTAMAGAVVLLTVETSLDAADQALEQTIAAGMAEQLLDEVLGAAYGDPGETALAPDLGETLGGGRQQFDEIGDYNGYSAQPPVDRWGRPLGLGDDADESRLASFRAPAGAFDSWRQEVKVYYVDEGNLSKDLTVGQTSDFRAVEVIISRQNVELARLRRVVAYVPPFPGA